AAMTLCDAPSIRGASWGDDGYIVAALSPSTGLSRIHSAGGSLTQFTKLKSDERTHRWPQVLPGSQSVLFTVHSGAVNFDNANLDIVSLRTGQRKTVQRGGHSGRYLATSTDAGHIVYLHQTTLFAVPFAPKLSSREGSPVPVLEDVSSSGLRGGDFA